MKVFLKYEGESRWWKYYFVDSEGFKTIVEGFKDHLIAIAHAKEFLDQEIEFIDTW